MSGAPLQLDALASGRAAFADRRWEDAFSALSVADTQRPLELADLESLGRAASLTGRDQNAFGVLERAYALCLATGDEHRAAAAAFWHGYRLASLGEGARSRAWLARSERIVDRLGDCVGRGYLCLPRIHHLLHAGDPEGAFEDAAEAMTIAVRFDDADLSALARQLGGRALIEQGRVDDGMRLLDEAMLIATTEPVDELSKGLVYCAVIGCCQRVFAVERAREWTGVLHEWCETQSQLGIFNGTCRVHRVELMRLGGAWGQALDEAMLVGTGARSEGFERAAAGYEEAEIHRQRGDEDAAELAYQRTSDLGGDPQPGLALLRLAQGKGHVAAGAIRRSVSTARTALEQARFLPACVEILLAVGDRSGADDAARALAECADQYGTPVLRALAGHADGVIALGNGDVERALPLLTEARDIWLMLDAPYPAARVRVSLAEAYAALGDSDGSRLEAGAARRVFEKLAARPDLDRLGQTAGPAFAQGVLSARELQVLRLVSTGKTNKEISAALEVSSRTVDRHMSNVLAKLVVPSRAAATAYAYEHGLIR
ncbi:MAG: hypothetical protein QOH55_479 [Microbacteriaceae bacterium]|jgi:DNA-binding CsgD family transcriptional regulator|nr:hypothetical protein [Microbacteriaceae bacterium]